MESNNIIKNKVKRVFHLALNDIKKTYFAFIIIAIYFVVTSFVGGTVCPLRRITRIPCPGCGLTRASLSLLTGHISESIRYNATAGIWIVGILMLLMDKYIFEKEHKYVKVYWIISFVITIIYYVYRITHYHINFNYSGYIFY